VDDILQGINHKEDIRRRASDSEVLATSLVPGHVFFRESLSNHSTYEGNYLDSEDA